MGSVMDQERPWEREEKPEATTMRERIKDAYTRGGGNRSGLEPVMEQIIKELERLEALTAYPSPQPIAALEPAPDLASENERLRAALKAAKEVVDVAAGMTSCRSDDEFVWAAQAKINAALEDRT